MTGVGLVGYGLYIGGTWVKSKLPGWKKTWDEKFQELKDKFTDPLGLKKKLKLPGSSNDKSSASATQQPIATPAVVATTMVPVAALEVKALDSVLSGGNKALTTLATSGSQNLQTIVNSQPAQAIAKWIDSKPITSGIQSLSTAIKNIKTPEFKLPDLKSTFANIDLKKINQINPFKWGK